ncbi:tripartite tricarboxylate transporter substrate binding protein [Phreatobacter stygius]|uniref:Tripartite tricarboxylate transporter substrate binding protein n=1 Tax=Phreatobacter stygius TaxID=1940610 RepID=A0A4D7B423_9HYPH|nr:tripartite tricarboxylate transporter substrate binding protein [Phreatobacter stygius]QCI68549.1 tripartite tricarboxylate transporter substrate binding protein [Phreatobacter stygius]
MGRLTRRGLTAAAFLWPCAPALLRAQTWPSGTIRLIVPFPAGGSVDALARLAQPGLERRLGATVIVENRPGAGGSVGANMVAKSPADGLTWLFVFDTHAVNPTLLPSMGFDANRDLDPVMLIGTAPMVITAHPGQPYRTLADIIAAARDKPGTIPYGTIGNGSLGHLAMTLLAKRAGVRFNHIPYRGGGPLVNDALGGHVPLAIASSAVLAAHLAAGTLRPIAQTGTARAATLSAVPTVAESGFAGFEAEAWWAVFAPAGTPAAMVQRFNAELTASFRDESILRQLTENQQVKLMTAGPAELKRFFEGQMAIWGQVVRENSIKAD